MVDITILEVHLPEGGFNAPFSVGGEAGSETGTEESPAEPEDGSPGSAFAVLLVLVALATLAWYLRGGGGNDEA